jgi:hypothetical protein
MQYVWYTYRTSTLVSTGKTDGSINKCDAAHIAAAKKKVPLKRTLFQRFWRTMFPPTPHSKFRACELV